MTTTVKVTPNNSEGFVRQHDQVHLTVNGTTDPTKQLALAIEQKVQQSKTEPPPPIPEAMGFFDMVNRVQSGSDKCLLYLGMTASLLMGATAPAFCLYFGELINGVGGSQVPGMGGFDELKESAYYMVGVGLAVYIISFTMTTSLNIFAERIAFKTKLLYFRSCLEKDASFYDKQNPVEMASKIAKEVTSIQRGIGDKVGNIISSYGSFVFGFSFAFYWGWKLALILLAAFPFLAIIGGSFGAAFQSGVAETLKSYAQSSGYAEQALHGIKVVQAYGREQLEQNNFTKYLGQSKAVQKAMQIRQSFGQGSFMFMMLSFYAYTLFWGGYLKWNGVMNGDEEYSGGAIMSIMFSIITGAITLGAAAGHLAGVAEAKVAGKVCYDTIDHEPKVNPVAAGQQRVPSVRGEIEFRNVSFSYPSRQEQKALQNFSCTFPAGKTTAIVGASGSGKSTIIQLIERFYDPEAGSVTLDGNDIKSVAVRGLRQQIGYVGQEPVLFNTSIRENLLFANPQASESDIKDALMAANAWNFIQEKMGSRGLDQTVGGSGSQLSGGQKQRIAIARALLKKPKILLLDEATSALDKANEQIVQEAIDNLRKIRGDMTIIVIAHRLSTIRHADNMLVLKQGELAEEGDHDKLMQTHPNGIYATFIKQQESGAAPSASMKKGVEVNKDDLVEHKVKKTVKIGDNEVEETLTQLISKQELAVLEATDARDKEIAEQEAKLKEEKAKLTAFQKLAPYNKPAGLIFVAGLASLVAGTTNPIFGVLLSNLLTALTLPSQILNLEHGETYLKDTVKENCLYMLIIACAVFFASFLTKYSFGVLTSNVTKEVRELLYSKILSKHMGWFDERDHSTGILTATMATETSVINGVGSESIGPQVESTIATLTGLGIGFYFCWQEALVCLCLAPIMMLGQAMGAKLQMGVAADTGEQQKEANLLCQDAISNYRTVQSFGHEEEIYKKFKSLLEPIHDRAQSTNFKTGLALSFSNLAQYFMFAAMFYSAGVIIENHYDEEANEYSINPEDVFKAIFAMFFAATQAGMAAAFGPDMGKATAAATKIFEIIESPSHINAAEIDEDKSKIKIPNPEKIQGKIEFKDVWFRYPTRKEDFVLRGLTLTINPNEKVALVGESGCGKSTFVNLMMRFYDVDSGEILLDGVNIKNYNLHDLRVAVSLVMQEPIIFNYSILENILYGNLTSSNKEVQNAAEVANCMEFLKAMPASEETASDLIEKMKTYQANLTQIIGQEKYDEELALLQKMTDEESKKGTFESIEGNIDTRPSHTKGSPLSSEFETNCGIKGEKLSGGQKQRVAIARSIIRRPTVLLLDEATSALDEVNQKEVQTALDAATEGRTTIVIAHRMSTIQSCDKVFVLSSGVVAEEGKADQLDHFKN